MCPRVAGFIRLHVDNSPERVDNDNIAVGLEALDGELLDVHRGPAGSLASSAAVFSVFQRVET